MSRPKPPALLLINLVSLALAIACSGSLSTPLGPTGSDTSNSTSGDTTIRGRASSGRSTSSLPSTLASGPSSSKVCVTGTNHCKNIDSDGQFEIKGNFVGDVHLTFVTPQGNTDVTIPGVVAGETLVVNVLLAGGSATVKIESRQGGNNNAAAADDDSDDDASDDAGDDDTSDDPSEDDDSEDDDSEDDDSEDDDSEDDDFEDDKSGPSGGSGK